MMLTQEFIDELNGDLAFEYASAIQYYQHATMLRGAQYFSAIAELEAHAEEELEHAEKLRSLIVNLGGIPGVEVAARFMSPDNLAMLQQDLDGEDNAIKRYDDRIAQARGMVDDYQDIESAIFVLRSILTDELQHRTDLRTLLGRS
jgi:bacterioferritin